MDDHDSALWCTCEIAHDLTAERPPARSLDVLAEFPPAFAADERLWGSGPATLLEWTARRCVQMRLVTEDQQVPVTVESDWAELVFIVWALARHRRHPQLLDGSWLPEGWLDWAASQRYASRLPAPALPPD